MREFTELPFLDAADAARGAEPQRCAVVHHARHVVAQQPVFLREAFEPPVAIRPQSAAERADPQGSLGILVQRADGVARQAVGRGVQAAVLAVDTPQTLAVGAGPDGAVVAFAKRHHRGDDHRFARRHHHPIQVIGQLAQATPCAQPEAAVGILQRIENGGTPQRIFGNEARKQSIVHARHAVARGNQQIAAGRLANRENFVVGKAVAGGVHA